MPKKLGPFFSLFLMRKPLSSGQKWFLRPYFLLIRGMCLLRSGLRFSFRALEMPEPRVHFWVFFSIWLVFRTHVLFYLFSLTWLSCMSFLPSDLSVWFFLRKKLPKVSPNVAVWYWFSFSSKWLISVHRSAWFADYGSEGDIGQGGPACQWVWDEASDQRIFEGKHLLVTAAGLKLAPFERLGDFLLTEFGPILFFNFEQQRHYQIKINSL